MTKQALGHIGKRAVFIGLVMFSAMAWAHPAQTLQASAMADRDARALAREIRSTDPISAQIAIEELAQMDATASRTLIDVLGYLLRKDQRVLSRARAHSAERIRSIMQIVQRERETMRKMIDDLTEKDVPQAREQYELLLKMDREVAALARRLSPSVVALARFDTLLERFKSYDPDAAETYLTEQAKEQREEAARALGISPEQARRAFDLNLEHGPDDLLVKAVWTELLRQRVEQWHKIMRNLGAKREWDNHRHLNDYRLALGIRPLMPDPRLIQAARIHCKDMLEHGFFAHQSPLPGKTSPKDRMRLSGYEDPAGENLAEGNNDAKLTFMQWFGSPGHHRNMMKPGFTMLGVGAIGKYWAQNFGKADPIQRIHPDNLDAIQVQGATVPPQ